MDDLYFSQLIFLTVMGMQYHPRNTHSSDVETIAHCIYLTELAVDMFNEHYSSED